MAKVDSHLLQTLNAQIRWNADAGLLCMPETVNIETLPNLIKQNDWLNLPVKQVDFTLVKKADSAVLSLLLVWAQQLNKPLQLISFPAQLMSLIDLYDMHTVVEFK